MTKCFTTKEAGEILRVCPETIRRIVREGAPHRRVGRKVLFTESDLAAILESKNMRGEVNPFRRKNGSSSSSSNSNNNNESEKTNNEQQQQQRKSDGDCTVAAGIAVPGPSI